MEVFVSVFNINVAGKITLISGRNDWVEGIRIAPNETEVLGKRKFTTELQGLSMAWPNNVPRRGSVPEDFLCIITDCPVDLRHLESPDSMHMQQSRGGRSSLGSLTYHIATGGNREMEKSVDDWATVRFEKISASFSLQAFADVPGTHAIP